MCIALRVFWVEWAWGGGFPGRVSISFVWCGWIYPEMALNMEARAEADREIVRDTTFGDVPVEKWI